MAEKGLGIGLGALLGSAVLQDDEISCVFLPISKVESNLTQPRKCFDEISLQELADSIAQHGVITPIAVRRLSSGYYQIIAGERRWRAARMAGLSEIPARIMEADDRKVMEIALIENLQREDLNPIEEAEGFYALIDQFGFTQEEAAVRIGRSRSAIANSLRLLNLPQPVKNFLEQGLLSEGHARAVLHLKNEQAQIEAAQKILAEELNVRQAEQLVKRMAKALDTPEDRSITESGVNYLADVENKLTTKLGRRVKIIDGKKKGRFEIEYYGGDDLELVIGALSQIEIGKVKNEHD